jgi:hypothetical protein
MTETVLTLPAFKTDLPPARGDHRGRDANSPSETCAAPAGATKLRLSACRL